VSHSHEELRALRDINRTLAISAAADHELSQERNLLLLESLGELRDIHGLVAQLVTQIVPPEDNLERPAMIFGSVKIKSKETEHASKDASR